MKRRPSEFRQHSALTAHPFGDEDASHAWWPDHAGGVELHELHVDEFGTCVVGESVTVAGVLPAVRRNAEGASDTAGGEYDRLGMKNSEATFFAVVAERATDAITVHQQLDDGALHVYVDPLVDTVVLQRADHLEPGAVADVSEARVSVTAEVALKDAAIFGAVEDGAPRFELAHSFAGLLRMKLGHARVVDVLTAAHRVGEVHFPVVAIVDVGQRGGHAPFGHDRVGLAEE